LLEENGEKRPVGAITVGADKGYQEQDFIEGLRKLSLTAARGGVREDTAQLVDGKRASGREISDQSEQEEAGGKNLWLDESCGGTEED
jgi:hypothetical protein